MRRMSCLRGRDGQARDIKLRSSVVVDDGVVTDQVDGAVGGLESQSKVASVFILH